MISAYDPFFGAFATGVVAVPFDAGAGFGRGLGCGFVILFAPFIGFDESKPGLLAFPTGFDAEGADLSRGRDDWAGFDVASPMRGVFGASLRLSSFAFRLGTILSRGSAGFGAAVEVSPPICARRSPIAIFAMIQDWDVTGTRERPREVVVDDGCSPASDSSLTRSHSQLGQAFRPVSVHVLPQYRQLLSDADIDDRVVKSHRIQRRQACATTRSGQR